MANLFSLPYKQKNEYFLPTINGLCLHHYNNCLEYQRFIDAVYGKVNFDSIESVPYLPVSIFKTRELKTTSNVSDNNNKIITVLNSSGTTGQVPSKIFLDANTSASQTKALIEIMEYIVGDKRLPMIIVDTSSTLKNIHINARSAGIIGMMNFGHKPVFILDDNMELNVDKLIEFINKNKSNKFLIFGFTFMVWHYFFCKLPQNIDLSNGILIHSGGWKKMQDNSVDNNTFKREFKIKTGLKNIFNFYGMAEQIGSVFLEGEDNLLYPSIYSDIIIRDQITLLPKKVGEIGIIQILSTLPKSYPGHSILTEDIGIIEHIDKFDSCGRLGKAFKVLGRVKKSEMRGCSDVY